MTDELTELASLILAAITNAGDWITRREIAQTIGRGKALNDYDLKMLDQLIASGHIEAQQHTPKLVQKVWQYRVKE